MTEKNTYSANPKYQTDTNWTSTIKPTSGLFDIKFKELWQYRDLIMLFVKRDFVTVYKQTILGPIWYFIQPLFTTVIFTIIFSKVAGISTEGNPAMLFYMCNTILWNYFASCINKTSNTFLTNAGIFGKVYFPRLSVPLSIIISNLITFGIQFFMFLIFYFYYFQKGSVAPNIFIMLLPILLLMMAIFGLGIGIIISSLTTKYRDLQFLVAFGVQLFMYATPVIYPISFFPEKYRVFIYANPMTSIIEAFRYGFLGTGLLSYKLLLYSFTVSIITLFIGIIAFKRIERSFMDTV
ncbi:MAG: ABC transporter permease [Bacteroidales bacterium]|nr:ABC transporter permease [Bacteroidales bacterium]